MSISGTRVMPAPTMTPFVSPKPIGSLMHDLRNFSPEAAVKEYPWATRFVMGLPLAPWQREFKWSLDQCQRFITSAWTGVHLGSYLLSDMHLRDNDRDFKGIEHLPFSNMVIDGQQRLMALELYVTDRLPVPDAEGEPCLWSEVNVVQQRKFGNSIFNCGLIRKTDELELRTYYDLLNFGGIRHQESERAVQADPLEKKVVSRKPMKGYS